MRSGAAALAAWMALACGAQPSLPAGSAAGDLIFRTGTESISHAVRTLDQGVYSHVGMLVGSPARWQVLHATPSERIGTPDMVVLDELDFFLDPQRSSAFAVFHVHTASAVQRQKTVAWALAQQGRRFHLSNAQLGTYCTALVWQAWQNAGLDLQVKFTTLEIPLFSGRYLMLSALAASAHLQALGMP